MGGFGSLISSLIVPVDEVYLCVPQTNLNPNSHYFRRDPSFYDRERIPLHLQLSYPLLVWKLPTNFFEPSNPSIF